MKKLYYILIIITLLSCYSCKKEGGVKDAIQFTKNNFGQTISLNGEIIQIDTLWKPINIWCYDSLLITIDLHTESFAQVYHKKRGCKVTENIPRGIGPGESLNCWSLQFTPDKVWSFDMQLAKIEAFNTDSFLTKRNIKPLYSIKLTDAAPVGVIVLPDSSFLCPDLSDKNSLVSKYDKNGIKDDNFKVDFPKLYNMDLPDNLNNRFWENRIYYNDKNDKIVIFYVYTDIIEIYNSKMQLQKRIQGPDSFIPVLGNRIVEGKDFAYVKPEQTKFAYLFGVLTDTEIWTLYYGISPEKGKELQNNLFVFDYNGNPLRHYELDHPISYFTVDQKGKSIYGISELPDPVIIQYKF